MICELDSDVEIPILPRAEKEEAKRKSLRIALVDYEGIESTANSSKIHNNLDKIQRQRTSSTLSDV